MNKIIRWAVFILAMLSVMVWIAYKSRPKAQVPEAIPPYHCTIPQNLFPKNLYKGEIREALLTLIQGGQEIFLCVNGDCAREAPSGIPGIVNIKRDNPSTFYAKLYMVEQKVFDDLSGLFENVFTPDERSVAGFKALMYLLQYVESGRFRETEGWRMVFTVFIKLDTSGRGAITFEDAYGQNLGTAYMNCSPGE